MMDNTCFSQTHLKQKRSHMLIYHNTVILGPLFSYLILVNIELKVTAIVWSHPSRFFQMSFVSSKRLMRRNIICNSQASKAARWEVISFHTYMYPSKRICPMVVLSPLNILMLWFGSLIILFLLMQLTFVGLWWLLLYTWTIDFFLYACVNNFFWSSLLLSFTYCMCLFAWWVD